jgi:HK97 family phage major capsid protein
MPEVITQSPKLERALAAEADATRRMHEAADAYEALTDDASDEDATAASAAFDEAQAEVERARGEVTKLERIARNREAAPLPVEGVQQDLEVRHAGQVQTREPLTYRQDNDMQVSFLRDLARGSHEGGNDRDARERLAKHGAEMRDLTRVDAAGGEFVPPLHLIEKYFDLARPARTTADLTTSLSLPGGTDSINIPRVTTGAAVAIQASDNAAVNEVDIVTGTVNAPVRTISGQQDVALQLVDQSPISFDQVVFKSLISDYAQKLDTQVISGTAAAGTLLGFAATVGINAVTYVDVSPTLAELYPKLADALNRVQTGRFLPAEAWVMHPRRWYWMLSVLDSSLRPFVVPVAQGPTNAVATFGTNNAQGQVGFLLGLPVYLDPSIGTALGAGTEDMIFVARFSDALLFEGPLKTRALFEVLSGTLTVRFQVYNYVAFTAGGYPAGISTISGTGLIAPTF